MADKVAGEHRCHLEHHPQVRATAVGIITQPGSSPGGEGSQQLAEHTGGNKHSPHKPADKHTRSQRCEQEHREQVL